MAALELTPVGEVFEKRALRTLTAALAQHQTKLAPEEGDPMEIESDLDDDVLVEFMERLDGEDAAADVYVAAELPRVVDVEGVRVASLFALQSALEEIEAECLVDDDVEEDEDDDEDFDDEDTIGDAVHTVASMWRMFVKAAAAALENGLCLVIRAD